MLIDTYIDEGYRLLNAGSPEGAIEQFEAAHKLVSTDRQRHVCIHSGILKAELKRRHFAAAIGVAFELMAVRVFGLTHKESS